MKRDLSGLPIRSRSDSGLAASIVTEATARSDADSVLAASIVTETNDRLAEVAGERTRLDDLVNSVGYPGGLVLLDGNAKLPMDRLPLSTVV